MTWKPSKPPENMHDWLLSADENAREFSNVCECGAEKTYGKQQAEYYHSYWCPNYKPRPEDPDKKPKW